MTSWINHEREAPSDWPGLIEIAGEDWAEGQSRAVTSRTRPPHPSISIHPSPATSSPERRHAARLRSAPPAPRPQHRRLLRAAPGGRRPPPGTILCQQPEWVLVPGLIKICFSILNFTCFLLLFAVKSNELYQILVYNQFQDMFYFTLYKLVLL